MSFSVLQNKTILTSCKVKCLQNKTECQAAIKNCFENVINSSLADMLNSLVCFHSFCHPQRCYTHHKTLTWNRTPGCTTNNVQTAGSRANVSSKHGTTCTENPGTYSHGHINNGRAGKSWNRFPVVRLAAPALHHAHRPRWKSFRQTTNRTPGQALHSLLSCEYRFRSTGTGGWKRKGYRRKGSENPRKSPCPRVAKAKAFHLGQAIIIGVNQGALVRMMLEIVAGTGSTTESSQDEAPPVLLRSKMFENILTSGMCFMWIYFWF